MKQNAGGSLTIYVQNSSPGADKETNCFWQAGLAHFGILFWPTPGTLKV
jgi:hypothetical protein